MDDPLVNLIHLDRQSPIAKGFVQAGATLMVEATTGVGKVQFLSGTSDDRFAQVFGVEPPGAGASCASGDVTISWLAPDEWLVTGEEGTVQIVLARAQELEDAALVIDLSHAHASFLLTGEAARDRLAAHTPLDISDAALPVGHVARAPLADTTMFLARVADAEGESVFRIIVDQTMAKYAVRMLAGPNAV